LVALIDVKSSENLWYRHVPKVAKEVGLRIKPQALKFTENEFIFLDRIPGKAVLMEQAFIAP